jgi:hypothetical protein
MIWTITAIETGDFIINLSLAVYMYVWLTVVFLYLCPSVKIHYIHKLPNASSIVLPYHATQLYHQQFITCPRTEYVWLINDIISIAKYLIVNVRSRSYL